jgi:hypothetical protein
MTPPSTDPLPTMAWEEQTARWPQDGRHVLAHHDTASVIVYQAYRPEIADQAVAHQRFGGPFSLDRMSWIKPNFLWMMYRCGWATKPGQERVLAVRIPRSAFDELLAVAVPSTYDPDRYARHEDWRSAVRGSQVRSQWDPDHDPEGRPLARRAIQLGLRGQTLHAYAEDWPLSIIDLTDFVRAQHQSLQTHGPKTLRMPIETAYPWTAAV